MSGFSGDQIDDAIDFLVRHGAEDGAGTVSYSRLFTSVGLPPPQEMHFAGDHSEVTAFMKAIHDRCGDRDYPPLDSLVVHVEGVRKDMPGAGYFRVNGVRDPFDERASAQDQVRGHEFWRSQVAECRSWGRDHRRQGKD